MDRGVRPPAPTNMPAPDRLPGTRSPVDRIRPDNPRRRAAATRSPRSVRPKAAASRPSSLTSSQSATLRMGVAHPADGLGTRQPATAFSPERMVQHRRCPRGDRRWRTRLDQPTGSRDRRSLQRRGRAGHRRAHCPAQARPVSSAAAALAPARVGHPRPDEIRSQGLGDRGAEATHQGRTTRGGRGALTPLPKQS